MTGQNCYLFLFEKHASHLCQQLKVVLGLRHTSSSIKYVATSEDGEEAFGTTGRAMIRLIFLEIVSTIFKSRMAHPSNST